jgi:hypothetical protein
VLFFALTGAAQLFSLHEAHGKYKPAPVVEKLSSVHKDQVFALVEHHAEPPPETDDAKPAVGSPSEARAEDKNAEVVNNDEKLTLPPFMLKVFFLLVALCLTVSTVLGVWMGFTQMRRKRIAWLLVSAGALIPAGLLMS